MSAENKQKINFVTKVMEVFGEIQKTTSVHKTHIFQLVKYSQENYQYFMYAMDQAYLKIFHSFHAKANKKIPAKFESLAESFFEAVLTKKVEEDTQSEESQKILEIFNSFLSLCSEGIYSTIMNIRVMCCRLVFLLVKLVPLNNIDYLKEPVQEALMNATLHILRTKVSTYRQLGIKLASLILHFNSPKAEAIEKEMFKILSVEDNEQIRKLVITNLSITKNNLEDILIRLRDKNPEIRSIVAKKLQGEKFKLSDMTISNIYKLLYDGYGSKETTVKKECLRYFSMFFLDIDNDSMMDEGKNHHKEFVELFRPDILLLNPHLYHLFDELIYELLEELEASMQDYIRKACFDLKNGNLSSEIIWLKNSVNSKSREISKIYDELGPTGVDLAKILAGLAHKNEAFGIFELLQLFGRQKMPDEIGRNKMFDALKYLLVELKYFEIHPDYSNFKDTDICHIATQEELNRKKLMLSYYDMPIIANSLDLIFQIGEAMKSLRPEHYEIEMKQVMSEWHNPEENTLVKEKELILNNINGIKDKDRNLLPKLREKLRNVEETIEHEAEKTRKVLMCISRLRYNCDLEVFMPIIKEELNKEDKAHGLLLLGLYCLENKDKVTTFWNVFWEYISAQTIDESNKNHVLVSLKVVIDFVVKFNSLSSSFYPDGMEEFNADMFMNEMIRLMLNDDSDIRILAIESLCRLLYHERVDKNNESTYFLYLILLWLETSTEVVSAKSVHTVSIFMKSYIEKGNAYSFKLAEIFCLFFKVLSQFQNEKKGINKQIIKYNLSMDEFFKKTLFTVMTIFKYQKESRNVIWVYNPLENEMGPQEFLVINFLRDDNIMQFLGKSLNMCDFFEFCGLETLILVKKILEQVNEGKKWKGIIEQCLKKLEEDIERQISLKDSEIFNEHAVETMEKENDEKMKYLSDEARYVHKNISDRNIFVRIEDTYKSDDEESEESENNISSESEEDQEEKSSKSKADIQKEVRKRKKVPSSKMSSDEEKISEDDEIEESNETESIKIDAKKSKKASKKPELQPAPVRNLRNRRK